MTNVTNEINVTQPTCHVNHESPPHAPFTTRAPHDMAKPTKKRLVLVGTGKGLAAGRRSPVRSPQPFQHAIFASEDEYDQSVESVVARIRSGQVKARTPEA